MKHAVPSLLILVLALAGCQRASPPQQAAAPSADAKVRDWPLPTTPGAAQPDLVATTDGRLLLSWISNVPGRRPALQFIEYGRDDRWRSAPRTIAVGNSFFINWADTPHIAATADGALWMQWLQKTADTPYAYDVLLSRSIDGGFNWSAPARVNSDGRPVEHGFVSLWPAARDRLGIAWLDGRNTGAAAADGHAGGMMTLRAATFARTLERSDETELDASTCDCCQTAGAVTARGPLVVYRDRTPDEIRDIAVTRFDGRAWSTPALVHADGWKMPACPVNGPAVAARGDDVLVAWYTAAGDRPAVQLARSSDAGARFAPPVVVDQGEAVQGRVALALDARQAWVLWVREDAAGQSLHLARYAPDLSRRLGQPIELARLQGRGRATGFPQLALREDGAWIVWTDIIDGSPQLRGAHVGP